MKKTIFILAAACMAVAANATILRVSNVSGSSAPYSTFEAAHDAANVGDTIMLDASATSYGDVIISKRLVVIGTGYSLAENGIIQEGASSTTFSNINIKAEGTVLQGLRVYTNNGNQCLTVSSNRVVVNRCFISNSSIKLRNANNSIIHQCYIVGSVEGYGSDYQESNIQVTNNIIGGRISVLDNSYIAYNTFVGTLFSLKDCTVERNIAPKEIKDSGGATGLSLSNNYVFSDYSSLFSYTYNKTDKEFYEVELPDNVKSTYGAFAGDSPYVLSGIPAAPVIQDLVMPTTVEKGSKMNVTIKVGIQK